MNKFPTSWPTVETMTQQAARWADLLDAADYITELHGTGFDQTWRVFATWNGPQIAEISIDGCGASWAGTDELWLAIIGPSEGVTA